jgi:cardiolipin synthase A/B
METFFLVVALIGIGVQLFFLVLALFEPGLAYRVSDPPAVPIGSVEFARALGLLADSQLHHATAVAVLTNGDAFYGAELEAIRSAESHICLEAYIFQKSEIGARFVQAMAERARAGVEVRLVLDAVGSINTRMSFFRELIEAGGQVRWYMPFRWYNLLRFNNRTHRELLVVDGRVGFIGGAGISDRWYRGTRRHARWRDTMFRVEGRSVPALQSMFAENWLESSGELLAGPKYYPECEDRGRVAALVINSSPSYGRSTRARMVFQMLIASAGRSIHITTPYFLPDHSARQELIRAMSRGVEVKIMVPGTHHDHLLTRRSSRRLYGELLRNGAQIFEYQPAMIHAKCMVVDGLWSVIGSTNFDHRSFGLNDEVNLAALDEELARLVESDFQRDVVHSRRIEYDEWRRRPAFERIHEWLGWIVERQE